MYYYDKSGNKVKKSSFANVKEGFGFYGTTSGESSGMSKTQIALIIGGILAALLLVILAVRYSRKSSVSKMGKSRYGYKFVN